MDWSKAKNIIVIALVLTNVFLIVQYALQYSHLIRRSDVVNDYTVNILHRNNIEIDCKIPVHKSKMFALTVSYSDLDGKEKANLLKKAEQVDIKNRNKHGYGKAADKFLKECGYMNEYTKLERISEADGKVTVEYGNYYLTIPLEDSEMTLTYEEGKLTDIKRHWIVPAGEGDNKIKLISPLSALLVLMSSIDTEKNTVVNEIKLVYYVIPYESDNSVLYDTAFPAWAIKYNNGQIKYISTIEQ